MRLLRDISGKDLATALDAFGYRATRPTGSHLRLTRLEGGEHHLTIPQHGSLRVGTLAGIWTMWVSTSGSVARKSLSG